MGVITLIRFIVGSATKRRGAISRIRLIKFLYLADVLHLRLHAGALTGLPWRFCHYGPYCAEAQAAIDFMVRASGLEMRTADGEAGDVYLYSYAGPVEEIWRHTSASFESALLGELERWLDAPLNQFLDHIYFETEPMARANRGDILEFPPPLMVEEPPVSRIIQGRRSGGKAREALRKFIESKTRAVKCPKDAIRDEAFERALRLLDEQDSLAGPMAGTAEVHKDVDLHEEE